MKEPRKMPAPKTTTAETETQVEGDALSEELAALRAEVRALGDRLKSTEVAAIERAKAYAGDIGAELKRYEEDIAAEARANPWRSLGFAALAGFVLGLILRR
jgi:ElaB/YqjD/DUF883 family membrane-anchored ribosome-binding protein